MKYYSAIISLFILNIFVVISLLYFANITRSIEKENYFLKKKINYIKDQININEIEYSIYSSYEYLQKLQKIYLAEKNKNNLNERISYFDLKNNDVKNLYTIGIKKF